LQYILEGLILGLSLSVLLGPIFVVLTQTSIKYGIKAGLMVGLGIWISDILFIAGSYFFLHKISTFIKNENFYFWIGNVGGLILIFMGIYMFFKNNRLQSEVVANKVLRNVGYWGKGFFVNTFNPFTFVFWFGLLGSKLTKSGEYLQGVLWVSVTILITIMATDTLKVMSAGWISKKLKNQVIHKVNISAGILLIIGGLMLIGKSYW